MDLDTAPSRLTTRLDDPLVSLVRQTELLLANKAPQLVQHLLHFLSHVRLLEVCKLSLEWPEPAGFCEVHRSVAFAEQIVEIVRHRVQLTRRELRVSL